MHGFIRLTIFIVSIEISSIAAQCQVAGCPDPLANNYNAAATTNNGSCTYNTTTYSPPVKVDPMSDTLVETSGLQMADNFLWSFNDGGGQPAIYRIDTLSNTILQRVYLGGASNIDWEAMTFDGIYFYVGDFGNNANGARTDLKIYKFPISAIPAYTTASFFQIPAAQIEVINFTYDNQPQPPQPAAPNSTAFDCEAMVIDSGQIHLFSKNWINLNTTHYVINSIAAGTYVAATKETFQTDYLVTDAAKAIGQKLITLLGYQNTGSANHFIYLLSDYSNGYFFNGNKRRLDLPDVLTMGQAEGISFKDESYGYISNEKFVRPLGPFTVTIPQRLRSFDIRDYVSGLKPTYIFTGSGNWNVASNWSHNTIPPASIAANAQIIIDPPTGSSCVLNVPYTVSAGAKIVVNPGKRFDVMGNLVIQ